MPRALVAAQQIFFPKSPLLARPDAVVAHRRGVSERIDHGLDFQLRVDGQRDLLVGHAGLPDRGQSGNDIAHLDTERRRVVVRGNIGTDLREFCKRAHRQIFREGQRCGLRGTGRNFRMLREVLEQRGEFRFAQLSERVAGFDDLIRRGRGDGLQIILTEFTRLQINVPRTDRGDAAGVVLENQTSRQVQPEAFVRLAREADGHFFAAVAVKLHLHKLLLNRRRKIKRHARREMHILRKLRVRGVPFLGRVC